MRMLTEIQATDNVRDWRTLNAGSVVRERVVNPGTPTGRRRERGELNA